MKKLIFAGLCCLPLSLAAADDQPTRAYFGDTHLHTSFSPDAGMAGTKVGPNDAYRFVLGETVTSSTGQAATISRPLDFVVIADHAENLGLEDAIANSDPGLLSDPLGKELYDLVKAGKGVDAFNLLVQKMAKGTEAKIKSESMLRNAWTKIMELADQYNNPGEFTAFIGYEWTSQPGGNNLHRVVVFRGDKASVEPVLPFSLFDSENAEDLWDYMAAYEKNTGGQVLAIPHNGNLSSGMMFAPKYQTDGKPIDKDYAEMRSRWEPIVEVTQSKGTGEAHPFLSPDDEFADFEIVDTTNLGGTAQRTTDMIQYEYARPALKMGLEFEQSLGANPFKFGMVGSTDSHAGLPATREDNWWGKAPFLEPSPNRWKDVLIRSSLDPALDLTALQLAASGLAGVWATDNTREAIWDAMARKEVFGTTGTRLQIRVFGGYGFGSDDLSQTDLATKGYASGVPMGSDLTDAPEGASPGFLVEAMRDPLGANLDRIQIVKGWLDENGASQEEIYNVVWSNADVRALDAQGNLASVGSTVNEIEATYSNSIGADALRGFWQDPDFDPAQKAFYYARVMEIPTPRWLAYDRKNYDLYDEMPEDVRYSSQERAYSSPIWYSPR
ncbi:MAG: DUF3604 domain-containing protein [Luminiphilus sp.]|nr:DUF3604 domain-containing protein [Luminiphilus sp.]MDG2135053.1 DUF3604 domain-containing protein [Luminiphilus sp.]